MGQKSRVRLYLDWDNLIVDCWPVIKTDSRTQYTSTLELFTSAGLVPTMYIYNSTNSETFSFRLNENGTFWRVNVPRGNITIRQDSAPVDQWYVEFSMLHGFSMFSTKGSFLDTLKGTLLDVAREPILQWTIGEELTRRSVNRLLSKVRTLKHSQSPCASDVAVMAPLFYPDSHNGVILSVTRSAFTSQARWFNATRSLCSLINSVCVSGCQGISIVDVMLTNCHLFLLTNRGLFISQDLLSPVTGTLNFTMLFLPSLAQMDYTATTIWFSPQCVTDSIYYDDDMISLISNEGQGDSLHSRCVYSDYPFTRWLLCHASTANLKLYKNHRYLSFLHDRHQHTGLLLSHTEEKGARISVFGANDTNINEFNHETKFPPFTIDFIPRGIFLLDNHVILYGSEVWSSTDRGSTFNWVFSLVGDMVVKAVSSVLIKVVVFYTELGHVYLMKSGLYRFVRLNVTTPAESTLLFDHMGILMDIKMNPKAVSGFSYTIIDIESLIEEHEMGFDSPLALQYTTADTVYLHEAAPIPELHVTPPDSPPALMPNQSDIKIASSFSRGHIGKLIYYRAGGSVMITQVFQQHYLTNFVGVVTAYILEPIKAASLKNEPMYHCDLLVKKVDALGHMVQLHLDETEDIKVCPHFNSSHVGKTAVAPGYSSYLITGVLPEIGAVAQSTMPELIQPNTRHNSGKWLLFDSSGLDSWGMKEGPCRHSMQSLDELKRNALVQINVREELTFTFKAFMSDHSLILQYQKKFMRVVLTNPLAMRVTAKHSWDKTNNHMLTLTAYSHLCKKATTTVTVFIPEASMLCTSASFTFTIQNSCPEGLAIVFLLSKPISDHDWVYGHPLDDLDRERLYDLPINYRPPSHLGIMIPTSDNIYNADPSQLCPREHYPISKNTGRYVQCSEKKAAKDCDCTDALRVSPLAINSDCRQRVLRLIFPVVNYNITLFLRRAKHKDEPLRSPYFVTVTEVNNRTNWRVTGTHATPTMEKMREFLKGSLNNTLYNPKGLQISLYGSELFHFRISVIHGVVLCDLQEEVQLFVAEPPLAFPTQFLVSNMAAVTLGILMLLAFLLHHNGVTIPSLSSIKFFRLKRKAIVTPANPDEKQD
ncbi:cation channel sperm-associated auxiliary subunit beta-like [Aplochiton taeniatus]